jgi:glycosyltransferase involved in cell wall biosynthesis
MKIGILTERLLLGFGVDLVVHEQARRLVQRGHHVTIFALRAGSQYRSQSYKVEVLEDRYGEGADFVSDERVEEIIGAFGINSFDILILHTPPFFGWIKSLDPPVIVVEYGRPPSHFFPQNIAYELWKGTARHFREDLRRLHGGDAIASISQSVHQWLPKSIRSRSKVTYLGADHYPAAPLAAAADFRRSIGINPEDVLILWVGRMQVRGDEQPYKGFAELRELIPQIREISSRVRVALLGKIADSERRWLDSLSVTLLPNFPAARMGAAYAAADVLLNLSRWEGFNLALVEAQYQGTPVIAYDVGPHREVTRDGQSAILVSEQAEGPLKALRLLIENDQLREQMGKNARVFAEGWTWDRNVDQLEKMIVECRQRHLDRPPLARIFVERAGYRKSHLPTRAKPSTSGSAPRPSKLTALRELLELDNESFIDAAFLGLLNRPSDPVGKRHYLRRLNNGASKLAVVHDMTQSKEFFSNGVALPDDFRAALRDWRTVRNEVPRQYLLLNKHGLLDLSGKEFVAAAFLFVLKRPVDPSGMDHYYQEWLQLGDRLGILHALARSKEARGLRWNAMLRFGIAAQRLREVSVSRPLPPILTLPDEDFWDAAWFLIFGHPPSKSEQSRYREFLAREGDRVSLLQEMARSPQARSYRFSRLLRALSRPEVRDWQDKQKTQHWSLVASRVNHMLVNIDRKISDERRVLSPIPEAILENDRLRQAVAAVNGRHERHVILTAPGTSIAQSDLTTFAKRAAELAADIVFGDECIKDGPTSRPRLRNAFNFYDFLSQPDLGGVIAVRKDLLQSISFLPETALTGEALITLVGASHTLAHLPGIIGERARQAMIANLPSLEEMRRWLEEDGIAGVVSSGAEGGLDFTFAPPADSNVMVVMRGPHDLPKPSMLPQVIDGMTLHWHCFTYDDAEAINAAVELFTGDYVLFLDAALGVPTNITLNRLIGSASQRDIGMSSALVLTETGRIADAGWQWAGGKEFLPIDRFRMLSDRYADCTPGLQAVLGVSLACAAVRREVFLAAGGLDPSVPSVAQGMDLCIRLRQFQLSNVIDGHACADQVASLGEFKIDRLPPLAAGALLSSYDGLHAIAAGLSNPLSRQPDMHGSPHHRARVAILPRRPSKSESGKAMDRSSGTRGSRFGGYKTTVGQI